MKLKLHAEDLESIFTREDIIENLDRISEAMTAFYGDMPPENFHSFEFPRFDSTQNHSAPHKRGKANHE